MIFASRYAKQYRANPGNPRPLFGAASVLERDGAYNDAVLMLEQVMKDFDGREALSDPLRG